MADKQPERSPDPVEAAAAAFREAWYAGEHPDPKEFCRQHSECGPRLLNEIEDFIFVAENIPEPMFQDSGQPSAEAEKTDPHAGMLLGDFKILKKIGQGGMGIVYEAEQISLKRKVALKILPPHMNLSGEAVCKFHREAEAGGRQRHPGIVAVHSMGDTEGFHYIAHELVEGGNTLADWIKERRRSGQLPVGYFRTVASLVVRVARALHHAHQNGVIHRDVKPSNILITQQDEPKVTDFGLALVEDALALSRTGDLAGTPYYMSPEQALSRRGTIDLRTDIFSLGVTFYELLTLSLPFEGDTSQEVLKNIIYQEPRDPCKVSPRVPRDLSVICLKAMEKNSAHRFSSMEEFADDLERYLSGEMIHARPSGAVTRLVKRVKRNPMASGLVALALVTCFALVLLTNALSASKDRADSNSLIARSYFALLSDPTLAMLLAIEAGNILENMKEEHLTGNALVSALLACRETDCFTFNKALRCATLSHDGQRLVVVPEKGIVAYLVDATSGEEIGPLEGHTDQVNSAAFNPDGTRLVTASRDGTAIIWNSETREVECRLSGHTGDVLSAIFSHDGNRIVTASKDMTSQIWDAHAGEELTVFKGHTGCVRSAQFDPSGNGRVVTASDDATARVWDGDSGQQIIVLESPAKALTTAAFSSDGSMVVAASIDGTALLWNVSDNERNEGPWSLQGHSGSVTSAVFDRTGGQIITASTDRTVRVWDVSTRTETRFLKGHSGSINSLAARVKTDQVVTASSDRSIKIWDISKGSCFDKLRSYPGWRPAAFSPDLKKVVLFCKKNIGELICCEVETGRELGRYNMDHEFKKIVFSPDSEKMAIYLASTQIHVWDGKNSDPVRHPSGFSGDIISDTLQFRPGGTEILAASSHKDLWLWNFETGDRQKISENEFSFQQARFNADGSRIATVSNNSRVQLWEFQEGKAALSLPEIDHKAVLAMFIPESDRVLILDKNNTARILDCTTGREIHRLPQGSPFEDKTAPCFSSDGKLLFLPLENGSAKIWDTRTGDELGALRHNGRILSAVFNPDNQRIATASEDETVRIWEARSGHLQQVLPHNLLVDFVAFPPEGSSVLSRDRKGTVKIWPLDMLAYALEHKPRSLTMEERAIFSLNTNEEEQEEVIQLIESLNRVSLPASKNNVNQLSLLNESEALDYKEMPTKPMPDSPGEQRLDESLLFVAVNKDTKESALLRYDPHAPTESPLQVLLDFGPSRIIDPVLSPHGNRICFIQRNSQEQASIMVLDIGSGQIESLCDSQPKETSQPAWHPSNPIIYFSRSQIVEGHKGKNIVWIRSDAGPGQVPQRLLGMPDQEFGIPCLHEDGETIFFTHYAGHSGAFYHECYRANISEDGLSAWAPMRMTNDNLSVEDLTIINDQVYYLGLIQGDPLSFLNTMLKDGTLKKRLLSLEGDPQSGSYLELRKFSISRSGLIAVQRSDHSSYSIDVFDEAGQLIFDIASQPWAKDWYSLDPCFLLQ